MYTEEEAKTKECKLEQIGIGLAVLSFAYSKAHGAFGDVPEPNGMCIASNCMKWRWIVSPEDCSLDGMEGIIPEGYCGLGGRP